MRWLRRLNATKMNPMGPDFSSAPWINFNLSGRELRLRCPPHEMDGPFVRYAEAINIYQDDIFEPWKTCNTGMSLRLLHAGWVFLDRPFGAGELGYVALSIRLNRRDPHYRKIDSMLYPEEMEAWILTYADGLWGYLNRDLEKYPERKATPIIPERDFWHYPQTRDDIRKLTINGVHWFTYDVERGKDEKDRLWHTPISEDHELVFDFEGEPLGRKYYSEDHDLDGAIERTVKEFMNNVHIKLD
ncbi:hypothetical protein [Hahella sp. HN01]|uniref:hypothetical protein n=1 Tax=Hahella sp. HN01 TaxID=2847262 RepID=UPI001C1EFF5F|nr:hypothetical protein [Hahella sp. HN01]MBU6951012.1 hypothetical protein [Hahella sp. HN01]